MCGSISLGIPMVGQPIQRDFNDFRACASEDRDAISCDLDMRIADELTFMFSIRK